MILKREGQKRMKTKGTKMQKSGDKPKYYWARTDREKKCKKALDLSLSKVL